MLTKNKLGNCGWKIVISEWNDTPKRLLGQKLTFEATMAFGLLRQRLSDPNDLVSADQLSENVMIISELQNG
jgi:hypothetical protein